MPTYDYKCVACDHRFELFQAMSDKPKRKCPQCGKNTLERLIGTGAAVLFKGSGFYQTDYRPESYKKAAAEDSGSSKTGAEAAPSGGAAPVSASGTTESKSASSETKPAAKPAGDAGPRKPKAKGQ